MGVIRNGVKENTGLRETILKKYRDLRSWLFFRVVTFFKQMIEVKGGNISSHVPVTLLPLNAYILQLPQRGKEMKRRILKKQKQK